MITTTMVEDWLGSDTDRAEVIILLTQIANGFYPVEQLHKDIDEYKED